ncbi:sodium-independent anion transporter [Halobacillus sp. Marseille-Q1614]|uniref:STAS domain-containing protein n=1 Tax=Halobacillus sp. Marseille-Q1614 TaxID=2709134 RepID=UPI00156E1DF3
MFRIDAVAIDELERLIDNYKEAGIDFYLAQIKGPVRDLMHRAGWKEKYKGKMEFLTLQQALQN